MTFKSLQDVGTFYVMKNHLGHFSILFILSLPFKCQCCSTTHVSFKNNPLHFSQFCLLISLALATIELMINIRFRPT